MKKSSIIKKKGLFDHLNQITAVQSPNYWDKISEEDKKTYSTYMINRFLSMKMEWVDFVNEIQKHWNELSPKEHYKIYSSVLPKGKKYLKYIKIKNAKKIINAGPVNNFSDYSLISQKRCSLKWLKLKKK